jgi:glycosyltransferase involved in cell wall biosynthesis
MRVALFLGRHILDHSGGTYSFERQLLCTLSDFKNSSNHEFFVFGWSQDIPIELNLAPHIHFVGTKIKNPKTKISFKFAKLAFRNIFKYRNQKEIIQLKTFAKSFLAGASLNISEKIIDHKIEMAWSLGLDCPAMEVPYIATVWDLQHRVQPYYPEVSMEGEWNNREKFYSEVLRRAAFIVTGTTAGQQEIKQFFNIPLDRIKIIPFATPKFALEASPCSKNDRENILKKYSITQEYLFYPAQFWPHKNHINLLLALRYLKDKYDLELSLVFAGSDKGNMNFVKQKVSELCLPEQVKFTGFIPGEDLTLLYQNAFALTFVTFAGPDNLPPLEAFALGCPVIASKVSGAEEQLGEAAILVNPKEPEEIASAIFALQKNPDLRQTLIQKGLTRAKQWTGQDYVREICSILDEFAPIRRCWSSSEAFNSDGF